MTMTRTLARK